MDISKKLVETHSLTKEECLELFSLFNNSEVMEYLKEEAVKVRKQYYGTKVFTRGLIEFTNYCKNNCYYCGIRRDNRNVERYRLSEEEILACCANGEKLGFRTFVLQGGEDPWYTQERIADIVKKIKKAHPDCAITLSVGEKSKEIYKAWKEAGADRYLLRHETANTSHYHMLHPESMHLSNRKQCLYDLKELGYQVGAGFMVGSPGQTLKLLSVLRLLLPKVLLPATTALGTLDPLGREKGLSAGANVVMPNLSPVENRKQYELYDNKICTGDEAAKCKNCLSARVRSAGYELVEDRGDYIG